MFVVKGANISFGVVLVIGAYLSAGVVFVVGKFLVHGLEEHLVGDLPHVHARLVQDGENSFVRRLHQITDDLIVEVINLQW